MLSMRVSGGSRHCDGLTRRELLRAGGIGLGGLTLPGLLRWQDASAATSALSQRGKAKSVIILFLSGGPSHLDMWDLKPDAPQEVRGEFRAIGTNVSGIRIGEHLPRTAKVADRFAIHRAMNHTTPNHPAGAFWMMVGSPIQRAATQATGLSREDRPHPGSVLTKLQPAEKGIPSFVILPEAISPTGPDRPGQHAGFLGAAYDPYRVNSDPNLPEYAPGALTADAELPIDRMTSRRNLLQHVSNQSKQLEMAASTGTLDAYYSRAFEMISAPAARNAFDITAEPERTRDRYGRHVFGQSVLTARRLVEAGVRLVQVNWVRHDKGKGGQGFDSHRDHFEWSKNELHPPTDAAFASLIEDLSDRSLLDETLVIVMGEFGRTPRINSRAGRDHWPWCFSVVLAGGGVRGGQVLGVSDRIGAYPKSNPATPEDLTATLYHCLGLDPHAWIHDPRTREYQLADGRPIEGLV